MIREALGRRWRSPKLRLVLARAIVVLGVVLGVVGVVTARWGLLFAGIVIVGIGASLGPGRIRRDSSDGREGREGREPRA